MFKPLNCTPSTSAASILVAISASLTNQFAQAQSFTTIGGTGRAAGAASISTGSVTTPGNVSFQDLIFPITGDQLATVSLAQRGNSQARILSQASFDGAVLNLVAHANAYITSMVCNPTDGCSSASSAADVLTRVTFRVTAESVLRVQTVQLFAQTALQPGPGASAAANSTTAFSLTSSDVGLLFSRQITTSGTNLFDSIDPGSIARLFPGVDYTLDFTANGHAQSDGAVTASIGYSYISGSFNLGPAPCPSVTPLETLYHCPSAPAHFSIVASGAGPFFYQWQYLASGGEWTPLGNGPIPNIGVVSGSATPDLSIAQPVDSGRSFRCVITNSCGTATSTPAQLFLCTADFNCDGAIDFFDYLDFVASFASNQSAADFNNDSVIDFFDYLDFVSAFSQGC